MTVHIDREKGEATLYGGSSVSLFGRPGITLTFRPRSAKHVLPDSVIREQLYRTEVNRLEREAAQAMRNAEKALWAAASLARHEVHDGPMSEKNAGRAHTLTAMLPKVA